MESGSRTGTKEASAADVAVESLVKVTTGTSSSWHPRRQTGSGDRLTGIPDSHLHSLPS